MGLGQIIFLLIKNWWWFLFSLIFLRTFSFFYLWWIRYECWYKKRKWIMIELKPPAEITKPIKVFEDIFTALWYIIDSPNWRERWCEGMFLTPEWLTIEIVSFGGEIHYYFRIQPGHKKMIESVINSEFPDCEITEVDDFMKKIPRNIPNEEFDLYGEDYSTLREEYYPIKTYSMFFEEMPEIKEEKRIEPMNTLLEHLSKIEKHETFILQMTIVPVTEKMHRCFPWIKKGEEKILELATGGKKGKGKEGFITKEGGEWAKETQNVLGFLISGVKAEKEKEGAPSLLEARVRMTPREMEIAKQIARKISKNAFKCWIRGLYIYKKGKMKYYAGARRIARSYFGQFGTQDLNSIVYIGPSRCRIHFWFLNRRLYLRKRRILRYAIERLPLSFPWNLDQRLILPPHYPRGPSILRAPILNAEELATIFHFPIKVVLPTVPRVEVKRPGPPPYLPEA